MLALLIMLLIGAGPAVAKTEPGDKKEKAPTEKKKKKQSTSAQAQDLVWYEYQLNTYTQSDVQNAENYIRVSGIPGCSTSTNICSVQLPDNGPGSNPTFDATVETQIWQSQNHTIGTVPSYIKMKD